MKYLKLFEHFGGNMYDEDKKLEGIYIGDRLLIDIVKEYKLKPFEVEIIERIFNNIPKFSHNKQKDREFVNGFINPEDMEEFIDSQIDVDAMSFNAKHDYMKRCHEYVMDQLNWYLEDTSQIGITYRKKGTNKQLTKYGNLPILLEELRQILENTNEIYRK